MFTDPVCGMEVHESTAPAATCYEGVVYYFCSRTCNFVVAPLQFGVAQQAVDTEISRPISPTTWLLLAVVVSAVSTLAAARGLRLRRIFEGAPQPPTQ